MASYGSKQILPAWSQREPGRNGPLEFVKPDVSTVTLPGNPPGLFPRASLDAGILLQVTAWATLPPDGETETVTLQIARVGSDEYEDVASVDYTEGTSSFPLPITLPADFLLKDENEGAFKIRYQHVNWVGTPAESEDVPVFIDKTPPNGTAAPGKITFSITPPFTETNLAGLTDVDGTIPTWTGAAEGDQVAFAWMKDRLPEDPDLIVPIDVVELGADRKVKFPVDLIRLLGDGGFCGGYTIFDKAGTVTGNASGNHVIALDSSGTEPRAPASTAVVHIGSGDATFKLAGGAVDLGAFSYDLIKQGENDWYLNTATKTISPGTQSVMALFNAAPTVWYGELSTLRSRMGEVRMDNGKAGGWIRAYGNKFDVSAGSGVAYQQTQQGLSFGADAPLPMGDGQWLVGLLGGYSKSDLNMTRGTSGTVDSYYLGAYTTWMDEPSGYYFDGVLKFNRFQNESDVRLSDGTKAKGDYNNNGVGASLEFGRHIKLADDYFVEPFTQLSGVVVQGASYDLDNGLSAQGDRARSLLGKVGATTGRNFNLGEGKVVQPYLRAAYVHEFAENNDVEVNNNPFKSDLSGSRGELGAGIAMTLRGKVSVHADFDYSNGNKIEQPWGFNLGARYSW